MGRPKKKQIETHGKVEETIATPQNSPITYTRLEQVWGGFNEQARYGTVKEEEYLAQLNDMNRTDMEAHARRLGVVILESTARLKDSLVREFRGYVAALHRPTQLSTSAAPTKPIKVTPEVQRILSEGK